MNSSKQKKEKEGGKSQKVNDENGQPLFSSEMSSEKNIQNPNKSFLARHEKWVNDVCVCVCVLLFFGYFMDFVLLLLSYLN
jgi:hypothetical protein